MLTIIYFSFVILVVVGLFIFCKRIPLLSSKITLIFLLIFLIIISILFFRVIQKVNNKAQLNNNQSNIKEVNTSLSTDAENYKQKVTIFVGTTAKIAPWSYEKQGVITGFNIDLAKETVKLMAKKISIKVYPNISKLYEALDNKEIDIIIDLEAVENDTLDKYSYSIGLVDTPVVFISNKNIKNKKLKVSDILQNQTIAVADVSFLTKSLAFYILDTKLINVLSNNNDVMLSIIKGKYNFGFTEYYSFLNYKKNNPKANLFIVDTLFRNKQNKALAFVVNSCDVELKHQLNIALNLLKRRGEISNLSIKYFNEDVTL